jgi:FMN phosphatase YigB (HAD superfamily)
MRRTFSSSRTFEAALSSHLLGCHKPDPMIYQQALALPRVREAIVAGGSQPIEPALDAAAWSARFHCDVEEWGAVARAARIEVN